MCLRYPFSAQHVNDLVKHWCPKEVSVNQQSFHRITSSWVIAFRISHWKKKKGLYTNLSKRRHNLMISNDIDLNLLDFLTNFHDFFNTCVHVNIDVADSLTVAEYWDALGCYLNVPYQLGRTTRDDEIDHFVQMTEVLYLFTGAYLLRLLISLMISKTKP